MQISCALRRMLSSQYSQRSPGYQSESGYASEHVNGQIRFDYGYVWTWKFSNAERSCGFKITWILVDGGLNILYNFSQGHIRPSLANSWNKPNLGSGGPSSFILCLTAEFRASALSLFGFHLSPFPAETPDTQAKSKRAHDCCSDLLSTMLISWGPS